MEAGAPTLPAMEWSLVDQQHILDGGSCLVLGAPGTGKTYFVRGLVKELRKTRRVDVIAKCHASARNFGEGCVTADHWVRKSVRAGRLGAKTVVIEELSQINCYLWNDIAKAAFLGVQFVLLGDFRQFPSVLDTWCGTSLADDALENSRLLWELAGGCRLLLTDNVRSDAALFDFYVGLGVGTANPRDLSEALEEARLRFPRREGAPDYTLVLSHQTRMAVNKLHNQALKPPEAVFYRAPGGKRGENLAQHMWLYAGQELIGAGGRVRKGLFVTVMSVDEDRVILDDGTTLTREQALASLRLAHAITYASCQGLTLRGRVRLGETAHPAFTLRHLYVGSSRCTAFELLEVC
jgi:hypothetical protein